MAQTFDLPVDVPWQLIAASPDMMDTNFCMEYRSAHIPYFPPAWRSSLAIYAYEPSPDDLPTQMCNQKITYLKVTCSITGYQPTAEETSLLGNPTPPYANPKPADAYFPDTQGSAQSPYGPPVAVNDAGFAWGDFTDAYFACYGVLLNVAVFPSTTTVPTSVTTAKTFSFSRGPAVPNPFASGDLTFTLTPGAAMLPVVKSPGGAYGILISTASLQIDLPLSTNVSITMAIAGRGLPRKGQQAAANGGTITAYLGTQVVFTAPLTAELLTDQPNVVTDISTSSPITRVVIQSNVASYLTAVSYSDEERPTVLGDYPHIIDFEPKTRDLYQAATDQSELLTGSNSGVSTGKSMSNTSSSEMGLGLSGGYAAPKTGGPNISGQLTGKWGNTSSDSSTLQIDSSRQSRETQGTTTNITQQYNLLTGYHAGTNRAAFLMLPRPHTLQATDYRTFVRGLRMIEGLQDFFLIVSRPVILPGICIEASLETGHFPEDVTTQPPPATPAPTQLFPFSQSAHASGAFTTSPTHTPFTLSLPDPWIVDTTATTPPANYSYSGVPGVFYRAQPIAGQTTQSTEWSQAINSFSLSISQSDGTAVTGTINITAQGAPAEHNADIEVLFQIAATQAAAVPVDQEQVVVSDFLVTSRELCVCLNSCPTNDCVMIAPPVQVPYSQSPGLTTTLSLGSGSSSTISTTASGQSTAPAANVSSPAVAGSAPGLANAAPGATTAVASSAAVSGAPAVAPAITPDKHGSSARSSIVYEAKVKIPRSVLHPNQLQKSRTPAARETMYQIKHHLLNSWRMPQRRAPGAVGFLESDYLANRLLKRLPKDYLSSRITQIKGLSSKIVRSLGTHTTVGDVLRLDLHRLRFLAKVDVEEATRIRRLILGFEQSQDTAAGTDTAGSAKQIGKSNAIKKRAKSKTNRK